MSQGLMSNLVTYIVNFLCKLSQTVIRWPTFTEMNVIEYEFLALAEFSGVVEAIDRCHIQILAPEYFQANYLDRNHGYSVNLMTICEAAK